MNCIMVVENGAEHNRDICEFLNRNGYIAVGSSNSVSAFDIMYGKEIDLMIVNVALPGIDGYEFVRRIRLLNTRMPIIMMGEDDDFAVKQKSFTCGADDYMTIPLRLEELLLRVGALLRRSNTEVSSSVMIGRGTVLNRNTLTVTSHDETVQLTTREFNLLEKLLTNPKRLFTREELLREFWSNDYIKGNRVVDVYITRLRKKFENSEDFAIETIRGLGYRGVVR